MKCVEIEISIVHNIQKSEAERKFLSRKMEELQLKSERANRKIFLSMTI